MVAEELDTGRDATLAEALRLAALHRLLIMDTPPEPAFDEIVRLAADLFPGCHATISFVEEHRTWVKASTTGLPHEVSRNQSPDSIIIQRDECTVMLNTKKNFAPGKGLPGHRNKLPGFLAGVPLKTQDGQRVGALCVFDSRPRPSFSEAEQQKLLTLAALTADRMELRGLQQQATVSSQTNRPGGIRALGERVLYLVPEIQPAVQARMRLESELEHGIRSGQMQMRYQPEIDLNSRIIVGFEALIRWNHPTRGLLAPDQFIPFAEETGLILPLGKWALKEACREAQIWRLATSDRLDLRVSVNLSPAQMESSGLVEMVTETLAESGLYPEALRLEITESTLMQSTDVVLEAMSSLRDLGVGLHMDDFGTGFSSLHTLHSFPFDTIKIDRSFIARLEEQNGASQIVQTIIAMCRELNLEIVAEGIETEMQADILRLLGCHFGQGFWFSPPLLPAEVVGLLEQQMNDELSPGELRFQLNPHSPY